MVVFCKLGTDAAAFFLITLQLVTKYDYCSWISTVLVSVFCKGRLVRSIYYSSDQLILFLVDYYK